MVVARKRKFDFSKPEDAARYQEMLRGNAARRKKETKRCVQCGAEFIGWAKQLYCSNTCNQKAWYYRHKNKPDQPPPGGPDAR